MPECALLYFGDASKHRNTVKQKTTNTHMNNNMIISGLHLDLTVALKNIVNEKMEKIFKHEEKIIRARVELEHGIRSSTRENEYTAKGHLELKGSTITISSSSDDLYKSIDDLIEKLDRGLRRRARLGRVKRKQSLQDLPNAA
jgi:putative sigma-54 modulation protein